MNLLQMAILGCIGAKYLFHWTSKCMRSTNASVPLLLLTKLPRLSTFHTARLVWTPAMSTFLVADTKLQALSPKMVKLLPIAMAKKHMVL